MVFRVFGFRMSASLLRCLKSIELPDAVEEQGTRQVADASRERETQRQRAGCD